MHAQPRMSSLVESAVQTIVLAVALGIEVAAGILVGLAALQGTVNGLRTYGRKAPHAGLEQVRLQFGRWLTLGLEFELGADILRTAVGPTWNEIGQLAAIIFLRTVLNYFLQKDIQSAIARGEAKNA